VIKVDGLRKAYDGGEPVLRGVSFRVEAGQVYTLLGPSGCGKTTSLRCVAGLEHAEGGSIQLGGRTVFSAEERINLSPDKRSIGMVFQSYAIWPHMTVAGNVAYPLEGRRLGGDELRKRVTRALDLVGLGALGERPAPYLSGGQQQRVALARALVAEPEVLLLDEPLSNLDAKLREQMRQELVSLQRRLGHTTLYVTHDQEEALALSHRIALMRAGEIVEEGDPVSMYQRPRHPFTAGFLGQANFITCKLNGVPRDGERVEVDTKFGRFAATARPGEGNVARLFFRPHHAAVAGAAIQATDLNCGFGRVVEWTFLGENVDVFLRNGDETVRLRMDAGVTAPAGRDITFIVPPEHCIVYVPGISAA
jgi:iron(III) transport system ATP-binding protein